MFVRVRQPERGARLAREAANFKAELRTWYLQAVVLVSSPPPRQWCWSLQAAGSNSAKTRQTLGRMRCGCNGFPTFDLPSQIETLPEIFGGFLGPPGFDWGVGCSRSCCCVGVCMTVEGVVVLGRAVWLSSRCQQGPVCLPRVVVCGVCCVVCRVVWVWPDQDVQSAVAGGGTASLFCFVEAGRRRCPNKLSGHTDETADAGCSPVASTDESSSS